MRNVFLGDRDVPPRKFLGRPRIWSAQRGRREDGVCFLLVTFFAQAKNSNSTQRGESSVLNNAKSQLGSDHGEILRNGVGTVTKDVQPAQPGASVMTSRSLPWSATGTTSDNHSNGIQ